jgi:2'-5' RNA ligase
MKTHHAAVVVILQPDLWEPIQAIRRRYDRHFQRWMPHVTLLYPFWPRGDVLSGGACATPCLRIRAALRCDAWEHAFLCARRDRFTLWIAPEPARPSWSCRRRCKRVSRVR